MLYFQQSVCAFLSMQSLRIGFILVLEGDCIPFDPLRIPFGTVTIHSDFIFKSWKCKLECQKKKKKKKNESGPFFFQYFGSVRQGQTNIFFFYLKNFFFRPNVNHMCIYAPIMQYAQNLAKWPQSRHSEYSRVVVCIPDFMKLGVVFFFKICYLEN